MKKTNNKGFSLVELIIVIAIMAVLIGVLAPQFIKYVERSRQSTDKQNVQEIVSAIQAYAADVDAKENPADGTVEIDKDKAVASNDFLKEACKDAALDLNTFKVRSKQAEWKDKITITVKVTGANNDQIEITYAPASIAGTGSSSSSS